MPEPLRPNYDQVYLFPPVLEDWVPTEHPVRFVRDFVASLDLVTLGFAPIVQPTGRPPYDPGLLLALWLYAYLERLSSSRQVERACYSHLGMIWLCGHLHPDHNTLANFLRTHRPAFKALFKQLVQVAKQLDLVGLLVHALDGTKIAAQCSKRGAWHRENLNQALARLDEMIDELLEQTEAAEQTETGEVALPPALVEPTARRAQIQAALQALTEAQTDHLQSREPEARMMKGGDGRTVFSYNAQAVVDATSGLIVAADVVTEAADNAQLPPMLDQVAATLGATAAETLTDGGYQSGEAFATLEAQGRSVLVNLERATEAPDAAFAKEHFTWQPEANQYVCPQGQVLPWIKRKTKKRKRDGSPYYVEVYQCRGCARCPCRDACTTSKTGRSVERTEFDDAFTRQRQKQRDPEARLLLRYRGSLIERIFGQIKQGQGFRRWTVSGLAAVQAQWALVCTTVNLGVFYRWWLTGRLDLRAYRAAVKKLANPA